MPDPVRPVAPREDELEALKRAHALLNKHQIDWLTHHGVEQTDLSVGGHDGRGSETSAEGRSESHDARLGRDAEVSSVRQTDGAVDCARDIPADSHLPLVQGAPVAVSLDPHRLPWRCFHCDEVFTDKAEAHEHFGEYLDDSPLCLIKGQDGGLAARVRELEAEVMDAYKQRNEYENDARLYHELSEEVRRRTNGHGLYMHLDYVEGEKLVLQEKVAELETELARLRGEATVRVESNSPILNDTAKAEPATVRVEE